MRTFVYKKLDDLKYLFESPCFFLANYYSELRNKIDLATEYLLSANTANNNQNLNDDLNQTRNELIQRINSHENLCLINYKKNVKNLRNDLSDSIKTVESSIDSKDVHEITQSIDELKFKLNKLLFLNKSYLFLKRIKSLGKLVVINEYLEQSVINSLTE